MTEPRSAWMTLRQCPLTCGLPTRMTKYGFLKACAAKQERLKKLAEVSSTDPHAAWCRECLGKKRPVELEIITMEEISMGRETVVAKGKRYVMPADLAEVLLPMSQAEAESVTLTGLAKFWRRPLIKFNQPGACPCCGGVHLLKSHGLCSGCNSDKVAKRGLFGHALLEHLAKRATGGVKTGPGRPKKNTQSTRPAPVPASFPASPAGVGRVESDVSLTISAIRISLGLDKTIPISEIPKHIDKLVEQRDGQDAVLAEVARALKAEDEDKLTLAAVQRMSEIADAREKITVQADMISQLRQELTYVRGVTCEAVMGILGIGNGSALSGHTGAEDLEAITASLILTAIKEGAWRAEAMAGGQEAIDEDVVARWSTLSESAGYEALSSVLQEAIEQAAHGKGRDRHADGRPFHDQPILRETQAVGLGFPAGQARKKILEAVRCCGDHPERAVADLLGAINYTAALVIAIRAGMEEQG